MLGLDQVNKNLLIINNFQLQRRRKNFINYKHTSHLSWHLTQTGPYPFITHNLTPTKNPIKKSIK